MANAWKRKKKKQPASPSPAIARQPGVLSGQEIRDLQLVKEMGEDCLRVASCDLRLGSEVLICGQGKPHKTTLKEGEEVTIESFGAIVFSTKETIDTSSHTDIVGRFDLMIRFGLSGLILQVGTQVEPVYKGPLFGLLINTQGHQKTLHEGQRLLKIEFSRMSTVPDSALLGREKKQVRDLWEFLQTQGIDPDILAEASVIQKVKGELESCKQQHEMESAIEDRIVSRKGARWTQIGVRWARIGVGITLVIGFVTHPVGMRIITRVREAFLTPAGVQDREKDQRQGTGQPYDEGRMSSPLEPHSGGSIPSGGPPDYTVQSERSD